MANNPKGLGKGLAALLGDDVIDSQEEKSSLFLPISQVESCASQPRKQFDPESLADLADSIREHGIIQPLTVRKLQSGYYQIIAGERRWRAAKLAGLSEVPAVIIEADARKVMELCGGGLKRGVPSGTRLIADSNDPVEMPVRSGYPTSIAGATASIVSQVVADYPVEVDRLTQDEKMEIMDILNRKGVFLLKGSVSHVAQALHSSEASIYRYLGKLNNK